MWYLNELWKACTARGRDEIAAVGIVSNDDWFFVWEPNRVKREIDL
jgi:hypothetical protein